MIMAFFISPSCSRGQIVIHVGTSWTEATTLKVKISRARHLLHREKEAEGHRTYPSL